MRPIELSRVLDGGETTAPLYLNPDHIVSFAAAWSSGSYVWVAAASESYIVAETPAQIIGHLADHRSTMRAEERDGIEVYRS